MNRGFDRDASGRPILGRSTSAPKREDSSDRGALPPDPPAGSGADRDGTSPSRRRRRPRVRTVAIVVVVLVILTPIAALAFGWWQYSRIPTVDVDAVLSARAGRSGTNYLIVGTDSREGISREDPNAGAFLGEAVSGARTDTIMILHVDGDESSLVSIPRDLWVTDPANGQKGRINATFAAGPSNLIRAIESLGIPVDAYLEINFVSFAKLVDAVGGITIDVPHPAKDDHSGLVITDAGPNHLNGSQALAYVRSRYYTELIDGRWRVDGTADIGRAERQRAFLSALVHELTNERNPFVLISIPGSMGGGMKRSTNLSYLDAIRLAWRLKDGVPASVALPVDPRRTSGGAEVLELQPQAKSVIADLDG